MCEFLGLLKVSLWFFCGAAVFSFIELAVERTIRGQTFLSGRSHCDFCGRYLSWFEEIPVFSFVIMRGKSSCCHEKIPTDYLIMEILGGILMVICTLKFDGTFRCVISFAFLCVLAAISRYDMKTMKIPDNMNIAVCFCAVASLYFFRDIGIMERFIGALVISIPMLLIAICLSGAFGGGDIKLAASAGLFIGWKRAIISYFVSILVCGLYILVQFLRKKISMREKIAFAPFLCIGFAVAFLYGDVIFDHYSALIEKWQLSQNLACFDMAK